MILDAGLETSHVLLLEQLGQTYNCRPGTAVEHQVVSSPCFFCPVSTLSSRLRSKPRLEEEQQRLLLLQRHRHSGLPHGHETLLPWEGLTRLHPQQRRTGIREQHGTPLFLFFALQLNMWLLVTAMHVVVMLSRSSRWGQARLLQLGSEWGCPALQVDNTCMYISKWWI